MHELTIEYNKILNSNLTKDEAWDAYLNLLVLMTSTMVMFEQEMEINLKVENVFLNGLKMFLQIKEIEISL